LYFWALLRGVIGLTFFPSPESQHYLNRMDRELITHYDIHFHIHYWGATFSYFVHPVHKHSFYEVCYVVEGKGTYVEAGITYSLAAGSVFMTRPNRLHQIQYGQNMVMLFVGFEVDHSKSLSSLMNLYDTLIDQGHVLVKAEEIAATVYAWKALWEQAADPSEHFDIILNQLSLTLLCSFHQSFSFRRKSKIIHRNSDHFENLIAQAKRFIKDNLSQDIGVESVANYLYISRRHLTRIFGEKRMSLTGYLREERIGRASELLKTTQITIKDIASMTGFHSLHYFTRIFTIETGISPARFRKKFEGYE
jgi:AraC-like DNA-binding protein/mannose-6-phosphate isomerase-like protein (cupin superfamily)